MTGLRARLRMLEDREQERRQAHTARNRERQDRARAMLKAEDYAALRRIAQAWKEDRAWVEDEFEQAFPDLPALPGEEEAAAWYFTLRDAPIWAEWPALPAGALDYFAADLARWEGIAARPGLTSAEDACARWYVAILRTGLAYARV